VTYQPNLHNSMVPAQGFEPWTIGLKDRCSAKLSYAGYALFRIQFPCPFGHSRDMELTPTGRGANMAVGVPVGVTDATNASLGGDDEQT
jgi:hypothetical protein